MGIFSKKEIAVAKSFSKTKREKKKVDLAIDEKPVVKTAENKEMKNGKLFSVLKKIRITEKSTDLSSDKNVIVFEINNNTNKIEVAKAVEKFYEVVPEKVRVIKIPSKNVKSRGKKGVKSGGKKAYVFLKKGDKIEAV